MTQGFIASVDISGYRVEKHRTDTDALIYQLVHSDGIEEFDTFANLLAEIMYLYHYPKPEEYATLYALLDAQ